jgi:hypothetical protein
MKEVQEYLESNLKLKLNDPYSISEQTLISFDLKKIKIIIGTSNTSKANNLYIQIEPMDGKKESRDIIKDISDASQFEFKNDGRYARMSNYKIIKNYEDLKHTFIEILKELKPAFESLIKKEKYSSMQKDLDIVESSLLDNDGKDEPEDNASTSESKEEINNIIKKVYERLENGSLDMDSGQEIATDILIFMNENNIFAGTSAEEEAKEQGYEDMEEFMIDNYGVWEWTNSVNEISEKNLDKLLPIIVEAYDPYR